MLPYMLVTAVPGMEWREVNGTVILTFLTDSI